MRARKTTITFDEDLYRELVEAARPMGFTRVSNLIRWLAIKGIHRDSEKTDRKIIEMTLNKYSEIKRYVEAKRLGSVEVFAAFAMEQYMTRYPLKTALKRETGESINE